MADKPFEIVLAVRMRASDTAAARELADKLVAGFVNKGIPSEWYRIGGIREEEMKIKEKKGE